ncbi:tetratricopeptide repeat protein [Shewanella polaris]|uniref:tetratricopeptide repeat protein n=1 Tax=Shewanella polaris TaxID=2588449 RepID=UPI00142EB284|nr:tetratricopeptide repeat protein [Shewanella polaris]
MKFSNNAEFTQAAEELSYQPDELHRDLELLARLNLEAKLKSSTKYQDAEILINQLDAIASTPLEQAIVIMLKARIKGRQNQEYNQVIVQYNNALNMVNTDVSLESTLFKSSLHEQLSMLHSMLLQPTPALSHLNRYREIAYQLRNDYFISDAETELGRYYNLNGDQAKSLQHYSEAFRLASNLDYPSIKAHTQLNLARTYRDLEQWDDALKYAHNAAEILQDLGQDAYLSDTLTVIAMIYAGQDKWNRAVDYYLNAQQVNERSGNEIATGITFHNLGEAYFKLNNIQAALKALQQANNIFRERKVNHYLVHNELLFAQIDTNQGMWLSAIDHANKAIELAKKKNLIEVQIEALSYLSIAYRKTNDLNAAIETTDSIIQLTNKSQEKAQPTNDYAELTEQKLKFELGLLQEKLVKQTTKNQYNQFIILVLIISFSIVIILLIFIYKKLQQKNELYLNSQYLNSIDPITQIQGYRAFIQRIDNIRHIEPKTLALVNINELNNIDIQLGLTESVTLMQQFITQFSQQLDTEAFIIRSGLIACYFDKQYEADAILKAVITCIEQLKLTQFTIPNFIHQSAGQHVSIGHISLPLLDNPDVKISATLQFETLQYALAAAMKITEQPAYVSLRPLNFAPAAIFMPPLFLNLTQALNRGIIRAESNHDMQDFEWPKH